MMNELVYKRVKKIFSILCVEDDDGIRDKVVSYI